jgi:hypothetical protein
MIQLPDWLKPRKPQSKAEWSIWIGVGLIACAVVINVLFVPPKPIELGAGFFVPAFIAWFLNLAGWSLLTSALLVQGLFQIRSVNKRKIGFVITILMLVVFIVKIGSAVFISVAMSDLHDQAVKSSNVLRERIKDKLSDSSLNADARANLERMYSRQIYIYEGGKPEYIDSSGARVAFQPMKDDILTKSSFGYMVKQAKLMRLEVLYWIVLFLATTAIGLFKPCDMT